MHTHTELSHRLLLSANEILSLLQAKKKGPAKLKNKPWIVWGFCQSSSQCLFICPLWGARKPSQLSTLSKAIPLYLILSTSCSYKFIAVSLRISCYHNPVCFPGCLGFKSGINILFPIFNKKTLCAATYLSTLFFLLWSFICSESLKTTVHLSTWDLTCMHKPPIQYPTILACPYLHLDKWQHEVQH